MRLPNPQAGEDKQTFLDRCMAVPSMMTDYPDTAERMTLCEAQWPDMTVVSAQAKDQIVQFLAKRIKATLAAVDLKELVAQDMASEKEIQIAVATHVVKRDSEYDLTELDFLQAEINFARRTNPLPVDYEHATMIEGQPAPAAGWITKVINKGAEGLWALVAWTERAAQQVKAGEYKFISPVFFFNSIDSQTGSPIGTELGPCALTNYPSLQGMQPVTAKAETADELPLVVPFTATQRPAEPSTPYNPPADTNREHKEVSMNEVWNKLFARLGIQVTEDTSDDQAIELVAKAVKKVTAATAPASKGIMDLLELPATSTEEEAVGAILALKHPGNVVTVHQHETLQREMRTHAVDTMIASALQAGKLTPAEKSWAYDQVVQFDKDGKDGLTIMKNFIERRPKVAPIGERLPMKVQSESDLDDGTLTIAKQMGVSMEILKRYAH